MVRKFNRSLMTTLVSIFKSHHGLLTIDEADSAASCMLGKGGRLSRFVYFDG